MIWPERRCRRSFLKKTGVLALSTMASIVLLPEDSDAFLFSKKELKVTKTRLAMGTFVAMTAIHSSRDQAEEAFGLAFDEVNRLGKLLSRHDASSPVSELNRSGSLVDPPSELIELLELSQYYFKNTQGAFDITVKPLVDLYQESFKAGRKPFDSEIESLLQLINGKGIQYNPAEVRFALDSMQITFDGIAKGLIVDRASEILTQQGVTNHLINAGGDIRASGSAAQGRKWKIGIQDPDKKGEYPYILEMQSGAVATSGNYEIYYDEEKVFHHIIDTKTGRSPQLTTSVSVTARSVAEADALATAVFVMGPEHGLNWVNRQPHNECYIITRNQEKLQSYEWVQ